MIRMTQRLERITFDEEFDASRCSARHEEADLAANRHGSVRTRPTSSSRTAGLSVARGA